MVFLDKLLFKVLSLLDSIECRHPRIDLTGRIQSSILKTLPRQLQKSFEWLVAGKFIQRVELIQPFHNDPYFPQYTAEINTPGSKIWANGIGETHQEALAKTIGEAVERFSLSAYSEKQLKLARYSEFTNALDPLSFVGPSWSQRQQSSWEEWRVAKDSIFRWVEGTSLISGQKTWVPAQLVYKPYINTEGEPIIRLPITGGAAAALSQDEAVLHGISELIEREAFLITYLNRLTPSHVNLKANGGYLKNLASLFEKHELVLNIYALPTDAPLTVILTVIIDKTRRGPAVSVGIKAHFDPIQASRGAILEAHHTRIAIRRQMEKGVTLPRSADEIRRPTDHALFWIPTSRIKDLDFLMSGKEIILNPTEPNTDTVAVLQKLLYFFQKKKFDVIWVDLTLPIFRQYGVFAGKALVPQLHPLFIDERYPYYGGERLYNLPVELGYLKSPRTEEELNHIPHPFP